MYVRVAATKLVSVLRVVRFEVMRTDSFVDEAFNETQTVDLCHSSVVSRIFILLFNEFGDQRPSEFLFLLLDELDIVFVQLEVLFGEQLQQFGQVPFRQTLCFRATATKFSRDGSNGWLELVLSFHLGVRVNGVDGKVGNDSITRDDQQGLSVGRV